MGYFYKNYISMCKKNFPVPKYSYVEILIFFLNEIETTLKKNKSEFLNL